MRLNRKIKVAQIKKETEKITPSLFIFNIVYLYKEFLLSKSFMKETSFLTPSTGIAL